MRMRLTLGRQEGEVPSKGQEAAVTKTEAAPKTGKLIVLENWGEDERDNGGSGEPSTLVASYKGTFSSTSPSAATNHTILQCLAPVSAAALSVWAKVTVSSVYLSGLKC